MKYTKNQLKEALKLLNAKKVLKVPAEATLKEFMQKKGYQPLTSESTNYTRRDGKQVKAQKVRYSNGKDYMVTALRFWKL